MSKGFGLFEALIALLIMSIFMLGVSTFGAKYTQLELESIASEISSAVKFAKFLAIIKGEKLSLECSNLADCSKGLRLYILRRDDSFLSKELIKQWDWPHNNNQITWHGFQSNIGLTFGPDIRHNAANGKFTFFNSDKILIILVINRLGKVRLSRP